MGKQEARAAGRNQLVSFSWLLLRMSRILFAAKTDLDGITHEQTVICRQLFAGHVVDSQPMKMGGKIHGMINSISFNCRRTYLFLRGKSHSQDRISGCSSHSTLHKLTSFIHIICVIEISEDEDSDDSEEDLEHSNHVADQNGGQPPQAKKLRR